MTPFQALVTGALMGAMLRAVAEGQFLMVDVEPVVNAVGDYEPWFYVVGAESGTRVKVTVGEADGG